MSIFDSSVDFIRPYWSDPLTSAAIFIAVLLIAILFNKLIYPLIIKLVRRTSRDLEQLLSKSIRIPLSFGIVVVGGYFALTIPLNLSQRPQQVINSAISILLILLAVVAITSFISKLISWYSKRMSTRGQSPLNDQLLQLFRRVTQVIIYGLGSLLILDQMDVNISPLIAGLGLGGLAVALAIQPTLSNLFAGTYVMTEGIISTGDFIEIEGGVSGYVIGVGWRSTTIRTFQNNLVVIPNGRFAETILTNYHKPVPAINIIVNCGTSYDSDLAQVEAVSKEVMQDVLDNNPNANKEYGGFFGYDNFGDSNVNFWLFIQANDRLAGFSVKNDLMQKLHRRFKELSITINYPVRTIHLPDGFPPIPSTSND